MSQQTAAGTLVKEGIVDMLTALLAGLDWAGAKLHLYKSSFSPTPANVAADFIANEADFSGYAAVALTYSGIGLDSAGNPTALSNRVFFQATDTLTPDTIGGCWVQKDVTGPPATHTGVEYYSFPSPVPMTTALAFVGVVLGVQVPGGPGFAIVDN